MKINSKGIVFSIFSVEAMLREEDVTSLRVFRASYIPPPVNGAVTVTRLDKEVSDLLPQEPDFYEQISDDDDDCDDDDGDEDNEDDTVSHVYMALQTPVDNDSLFNSVSFALTGQWVDCDAFRFICQQLVSTVER